MKRGRKGSIVIIMTGLLTQIYYCYPWIRGGEHTYTGLTWLSAVFREGGAAELVAREFPLSQELGGNAGAFALQFTGIVLAVTIAQLLTVATILAVFSGRLFKLGSTIALVLGGACCMIIANPVRRMGFLLGNRGDPFGSAIYLSLLSGGGSWEFFSWFFERWRPGMKGPGGCIRTGRNARLTVRSADGDCIFRAGIPGFITRFCGRI